MDISVTILPTYLTCWYAILSILRQISLHMDVVFLCFKFSNFGIDSSWDIRVQNILCSIYYKQINSFWEIWGFAVGHLQPVVSILKIYSYPLYGKMSITIQLFKNITLIGLENRVKPSLHP